MYGYAWSVVPSDDLGRHRRGPSRRLAHVERHELVDRRQVPLVGVVHLVEIVDALGVGSEEARGEAQRIARAHLPMVRDVRLQTERGHLARRAVRPVQPDVAEPGVGGEVEGHEMVAHVHVPVVVDPLRAESR